MNRLLFSIFVSFVCLSNVWTQLDSILIDAKLEEIHQRIAIDPSAEKSNFLSALDVRFVNKSPYFTSVCYNGLGEVYTLTAQYDSAMYYFDLALTIRMKYDFEPNLASTYEGIAKLYQKKKEYDIALEYLFRSRSIKEKIGNISYLKGLYTSIGNTYYYDFQDDSAYQYYLKAYDIYLIQSDSQGIASSFTNFGNVLFAMDYDRKAITSYKRSIEIYGEMKRTAEMARPMHDLAYVYDYLEINDSAKYFYVEALKNARTGGNYQILGDIYNSLGEFYVKLGESDSAISVYQDYVTHLVSVSKNENDKALYEANSKFNVREERLEKEKFQLESSNKTIIIVSLIIAFALILIVVFIIIRNSQQRRKLQLNAKKQEIDQLLKEQEARSYVSLLEGRNAERERIAQDLHDLLGGTLARFKHQFESMREKIKDLETENERNFEETRETLELAVESVREISRDLMSGRIAKLGLRGALEDLVKILNSAKKMEVDFVMDYGIEEVDSSVEKEIYAIFQELVSNTLKHANATHIEMQLNQQDKALNIVFEDNGAGFDFATKNKTGLGLSGLSLRVEKLKGSISFDSVIGRGTIVIINIPYEHDKIISGG